MNGAEGLLAAVSPIVVAVVGLYLDRRLNKQDRALRAQDGKINEIHVLVNARLTEALDRIAALTRQLAQETPESDSRALAADSAAADAAGLKASTLTTPGVD